MNITFFFKCKKSKCNNRNRKTNIYRVKMNKENWREKSRAEK